MYKLLVISHAAPQSHCERDLYIVKNIKTNIL